MEYKVEKDFFNSSKWINYLNFYEISEMVELRTLKLKKLLYVWNPKKKHFVKLRGLDKDVTKASMHNFQGYSVHEQTLKYVGL